ncbi:hypothetical protein HJ526_14105 [Donghicola sp. C2-DW-16]|uniref:Uncharacterized protein n=2 Tax=Donghicola mangrovi TaxID=2729614 RepID=A0ABX2PHI1_9RHOB|nr:hypothetical protein [Donghicola mangrovi]
MGRKPENPLFLERQRYRMRRIMDAARFAPVLAAFLFLIPLMWGAGQEVPTASALIFIFGAWAGLIAVTAFLSHKLRKMPRDNWQERP